MKTPVLGIRRQMVRGTGRRDNKMKKISVLAYATLLTSVAATQGFAHSTFVNETATAESTFVAALQVPHGCDGGLATTEVQVQLPEGFISAKPQPKAGWELEIIKGDYQKAYSNHGKEIKSGPVEFRWKNGNLPDEFYDTFVFQGKISGVEAGTDLPFKVKQLCGDKGTVVWDQVAEKGADPHSLANPAPVLKIATKAEHGGGHDHGAAPAGHGADHAAAAVKVGDLEVAGGFSKAMLPGQPVGGGFVTITNSGKADDKLVSAVSDVAGRVELHEMAMQGEVMKMRKLDDGITVPAGETVELKPGGLHFMFFEVKKPFAEGDTVPVTLTFEKAGKVDITLSVQSAKPGEASEHKHN
jgi:uncharacterized protein YcnI/copper(I)-binding protein